MWTHLHAEETEYTDDHTDAREMISREAPLAAACFAIERDVENMWYRCYQIAIVIDSVHRSLVGHRYGQQNAVTAENMYKEAAGAFGEPLPRS